LQRGCAAFNGLACARLARGYEEGDGTAANTLLAGEMRDKACAAGDGRSCRQRACTADTDNRALELWQMGCSRGDAPSCALAQLAAPRPSTPAPEPEKTAAKPAAAPPAVTAQAEVSKARQRLGVTLVAVGVLAAASAAFIAAADGHEGFLSHRFERFYSLHREAERSRKGLMYAMGAAALLSGGVGVAILLTRPEPAAPQVSVGIAPGALLLSGTFP
jgi:hypothetical protein